MKKLLVLTTLILTLSILFFNVQPAFAVPPQPSGFYGTVKIDGANVAAGTAVTARISGVTYATSEYLLYNGDTVYSVDVPGEDPDTAGTQGGVAGDTVVFFIGAVQASQTGTWASGTNLTLNLTASTPPGDFNKSSPANAATGVALNPTLSWGTSSGATSYEYCNATTTGCTSWTSVGANTSVALSGLANNTTYYWQVRAVKGSATTLANTGTYWSFTTVVAAPGAFNKSSPANAATNVATNPTLSWAASSGAASYAYCYATTTGCTSWTSVGTNTSVAISGLANNQQYYWQVRATNAGGDTLANSGTYWSFTTVVAAPGAFNKTSPTNAATGIAINPTLSWGTSSGAVSYSYCYATTTGCTSWTSTGTNTSVALSGLANNQVYYWQARATNPGGNTLANTGTYWSFTTVAAPPGAFNKTSPANAATGVAVNPTLSWGTSTGAATYEYCYATTTGCTNWTSRGTNTSVALSGLANNTTYYWQARAVNTSGNTLANSGTYWSFTTVAAVPGAFNKTSPANAATGVATNPTLSWGTSTNATSYEYCYATTTGCTNWTSVGTNTSVALSGLANSQQYYWQVRAVNGGGNTLANTGTYWSFTTAAPTPPGAFNKTSPANAATGIAVNPTLSWGASTNAVSYEYCYATTTGCTTWTSVGTNTSVALSGLANNQIYYWQVRAVNTGGNTLADGGTYWSFTTVVAAPGAFAKTSPANAATGIALTPTLSWAASTGATSYEYCYATTTGCTNWTSAGTNTSVGLSGLANGQVYYWQVRALNGGGNTLADSGTYWSFTTVVTVPGAFAKTSPANAATGAAINPTLSWSASSGAVSYEYCYATTTGCTSWTSVGTNTSVALSGLANDTTYYWQVRAVNGGGNTLADAGTYWSFTTVVAGPAAFAKTSPANAATGVANSPTLSWGASTGAISYEYCYATTTGCTSWTSAGTSTSVAISGLSNNQVYYWQVRALNAGGNTLADAGTYWSFTTVVAGPGAFAKTSPANAATGVVTNPTLSWGTSSSAVSYEYCYATTTGCTSWTSVGANTSVALSGLSNNTTYYWQVRAVNPGGNTLADSGTYWSFTTVIGAPGTFAKTSPANEATGVAINTTLSWGASAGAASYEYCYAYTSGCTSWTSVGTNTSVALSGLLYNQVYYWQVRAVNGSGNTLADSGTYWSFTTLVPTYVLTVNKTGTGSGVVTSIPSGIDCGAACSYSFPNNTVVTLTAAPSAGSTFGGWSGAGCSGTGTCQVTVTMATTVTATFTKEPYLLYLPVVHH